MRASSRAGQVEQVSGVREGFSLPQSDAPLDRVLLVPFQSSNRIDAERHVLECAAAAFGRVTVREHGAVLLGEIAGEAAEYAPPPYFPPRPIGLAAAGTPAFVSSFTFGCSKALGGRLVAQRVDRIPPMPVIAGGSGERLWLCAEGELASKANALARAGWRVTLCDVTCFEGLVEVPTQHWLTETSGVASTAYMPPPQQERARARGKPREPGEPTPGDHIGGIGLGAGVGVVLRVERRGGKWTRVLVSVAEGCIPGPAYPGQPSSDWRPPSSEMWLTREFVEHAMQKR